MVAMDSQYLRFQTLAGGSACSNLQLLRVAYSKFSPEGKKLIEFKEHRKEFYKSLLEKHHRSWF
jgi:hypothetical protein